MYRFAFGLILSVSTLLVGMFSAQAITVGEPATFEARSDGASTYLWTFPGPVTKSGAKVEYTFPAPGSQSVTLKVTGSDGQTNEITKNVIVENGDRPTAIIEVNTSGVNRSVSTLKVNLDSKFSLQPNLDNQDESSLEYYWVVKGQQIREKKLSEKNFKSLGNYNVKLQLYNKDQTALRDEAQVNIIVENQAPIVKSLSVKNGKSGQAVSVKANAEDKDGKIESYRFEVLENGRSVLTQLVTRDQASFNLAQYPGPHLYNFRVTVTDDRGQTDTYTAADTLKIENIIENEPPTFDLIVSPGNEGLVNEWFNFLADGTDPDGDALRYQWLFPDGDQFFSSQIRHQFRTGGEKEIIARVSDGIEIVEKSIKIKVNSPENEAPTVEIVSVSPDVGDTSTLFKFAAIGKDADRDSLTYVWDMGDGGKAVTASPSYRYATAGSHQVTVEVSDGTETARNTKTFQVAEYIGPVIDPETNNAPTVSTAALPLTGTTRDTFRFTSQASDPDGNRITYQWEMGDGVRYFAPQVAHKYVSGGTYEATLTVSDSVLDATSSVSVEVADASGVDTGENSAPEVRILSVTPQMSGDTNTIFRFFTQGQDQDGDQLRYTWDMGDEQQMFIQNPAYRFLTPGTYTVRVSADDGLSTTTDEVTITVVDQDFHTSGDVDPDAENLPPILSITAVAPSTTGDYRTVFRLFSRANDPEGTALDYQWDMGDGNIMQGPNPYYRYTTPGTYLIKGTVTDGGLSAEAEVTLVVEDVPLALKEPEDNEPPSDDPDGVTVSVDEEGTVIINTDVTDPNGDEVFYRWDMGDGAIYFTENVNHHFAAPGTYLVVLEITDGLGVSRITKTVIIPENSVPTDTLLNTNYTSLGLIESIDFSLSSCPRFGASLGQSGSSEIDFTSSLISLRDNIAILRSRIAYDDILEKVLNEEKSALANLERQQKYIAKWQSRSQAGLWPLTRTQEQLTEAQWNDLLSLGLTPESSLKQAQSVLIKTMKPMLEDYKATSNTQEKAGIKASLQKWMSLRSTLNQWHNLSEDKPTLTQKEARFILQKKSLAAKMEASLDPKERKSLEQGIKGYDQLLEVISQVKSLLRTDLLARAQTQLTSCLGTELDASDIVLLEGFNLEDISTGHLISALADIEGTPETTFFLYAKASEIYAQKSLLFEWDLGDGRSVVGQNIHFKYATPGLYEVTLKVSDELTSSRDRLKIRVYSDWPQK